MEDVGRPVALSLDDFHGLAVIDVLVDLPLCDEDLLVAQLEQWTRLQLVVVARERIDELLYIVTSALAVVA